MLPRFNKRSAVEKTIGVIKRRFYYEGIIESDVNYITMGRL